MLSKRSLYSLLATATFVVGAATVMMTGTGCSAPPPPSSLDGSSTNENDISEEEEDSDDSPSSSSKTKQSSSSQTGSSSSSSGGGGGTTGGATTTTTSSSSSSSGATPPPPPPDCFTKCIAAHPQAANYVSCVETKKCTGPGACDDDCWFGSGCGANEISCFNALDQCDAQCPL